jgi:hypothetical protein
MILTSEQHLRLVFIFILPCVSLFELNRENIEMTPEKVVVSDGRGCKGGKG